MTYEEAGAIAAYQMRLKRAMQRIAELPRTMEIHEPKNTEIEPDQTQQSLQRLEQAQREQIRQLTAIRWTIAAFGIWFIIKFDILPGLASFFSKR